MQYPTESLPFAVYSVADIREIERRAIEERGVAGYELMKRAGAAAAAWLRTRWPATRRVVVVCGLGNNAGDGFVVARLARSAGFDVRVLLVATPDRLKGDAARAAADYQAAGGAFESFDSDALADADVIVDALLGTGLDRLVTGEFLAAIEAMNSAGVPILSLDVPSGLDADCGWPRGDAVRATATMTFIGLKQGLYLGGGVDFTGALVCAGLDLPADVFAGLPARLTRLGASDLERALPPRPRSAHKGLNGRLLLVGGGPGMAGAIRLAAEAALRVGAGLVYVATTPDNVGVVLAGRPEIIARGVTTVAELDALVALADAAVLGPGLGQTAWARTLWRRTLETSLPLVVDADALNLLAAEPSQRSNWVLTPHPGEAARLLGLAGPALVQQDRLQATRDLARRYGAVAVLKGAHTLIATPADDEAVYVCDRGNPGMATAGMGDVLAGVLGSLLVQTRALVGSVRAGVLLHALAGDSAATPGERGTLAADLLPELRRWANRD
jgi:ADP-dependent NAD(P)H-hydrate dehydratase / NAD(P)H-hydrate epimerase